MNTINIDADCVNAALEENGHTERVDHRSYEQQGIDQIPTVHLGVAASQIEKRGIRTERGDINREIEVLNQTLRQLKARIGKLKNWLKEEQVSTAPTTLADYIQSILSRKVQAGKSSVSQSIYNLKDASKMLNFLTAHSIMDMVGLDEKFSSMLGEQLDIADKLKPIDRRLPILKKHIEQADIYFKHRGKKTLNKAEQIRKSVYDILRQEQRKQQPYRVQDMEVISLILQGLTFHNGCDLATAFYISNT